MASVDDRGRRTAPTRRQQRNVTPPRVVPSHVRDDKSDADRARAENYKAGRTKPSRGNPTYAQGIRAGYAAASPEARRAAADKAESRSKLKGPKTFNGIDLSMSREDRIVLAEHKRRLETLRRARAYVNPRNDVAADMVLAKQYKKDNPYFDESSQLQTGDTAYGPRRGSTPDTQLAAAHPGIETAADRLIAAAARTYNDSLPEWFKKGNIARAPGDYSKATGYHDPVKDVKNVGRDQGAGNALGIMASLDLVTNPGNILAQAANLSGDLVNQGLATIHGLPTATYAIPGMAFLKGLSATGDLAGNAVKDVINVPAETLPSLYAVGAKAAHGDPKGAAQDLAQPFVDVVTHPVRSFKEHPVNTILLGKGLKSAAGRSAGRVMRAVPGPTQRAASTARAPIVDEATGLTVDRTYSPDVISKAGQVASERARSRAAGALERRAEKVGGDRAVQLRERAAQIRREGVPKHEFQRRVDERVDTNEQVRRDDMAATKHAARKAIRRVHPKERPLVALVARGAVPATREGVTAYLKQIEAEGEKLSGAKRAANRETIKHLKDALARDVDWGKVREASKAYAAVRAPLDKGLGDAEIVNPAQAERRRLLPFVVQQLGGKLKSADELDGAVKDARQRLHEARQERVAHERTHADAVAGFGVARGRAQVLSRQVGGTAAERRAAAATVPAGETQFAGGGHGVQQAADALRRSTGNVEGAKAAERAALEDLRGAVRERRLGSGFILPDGRRLTNEQIRAEMRRRGVDEPAFLTDAPNRRGARNFYRNQMEPANAGSGTFTGEALRQGTIDLHPETLIEGAGNAQSLLSQQHGFGRMLHEFGVRGADGEVAPFGSYKEAAKAARDAAVHRDGTPRPGAVKLTPIRINPFGGSNAQLEKLLNEADLDPMARRSIHDALHSALSGSDGPGPWALVPEVVAKRMQEHLRVLGAGGAGKVANVLNQAFRRTVLATSVPWLVGNLVEGAGRALVAHAGPLSWATGHRLMGALDVMDPRAAQELRARALNGAHISMAERQKIRRAAEDFDGRFTQPMARALGAFWRAPGPKQVAGLWNIWTEIAFNQINGRFERNVQKAMLGRAARRSPLMEGNVGKLGNRAIQEAARGLTNTSTQVALARSVDRMYGRYSKFSPTARKYIANYTPFLAWSLAAANFVYRVLPRDHPVLTSLIVSANEATQDWRREHGLDLFFKDGRLPPWLQGSIPLPGGGHVRVSRYTPFGAFGAPSETIESLVLPQTQGVLAALRGEDWKGTKLRDSDGQPVDELGRWTAAVGSFLESVTPALAQTKRVLGEDSVGAGLKKIANPLPVIAPSEDEAVAPSGPMDPKMSRAFRRAQTSAARRGGQSKQLERAFKRAQRLAAQQP